MSKTRFENLTETEKNILNELTIGYGNLTIISLESGIEKQTLRNVRRNGYGHPETIKTIRKKLLSKHKSKEAIS